MESSEGAADANRELRILRPDVKNDPAAAGFS